MSAGRYFYQRKVPLDFQRAVGRKKWRAPLGNDFDAAYTRLKDIKAEHDALLKQLQNPDEKRDHTTAIRRNLTDAKYKRWGNADTKYENWCRENGTKTDHEEYLAFIEENDLAEPSTREQMERWLHAFDHERTLPGDQRTMNVLPSRIPQPMDDDEYHDLLCGLFIRLFGNDITPPTDPDERDEFDTSKIMLERKIARVARDPDTISRVAEKFYDFAQIRNKTENKYRRTITRLIEEIGDLPISQVTPRMMRDYRDKLKGRRLLPSSIRAEFSPVMGLFGYAVDEELIETSPMISVKLPKERRAVEEIKWLPFDTDEIERIFFALDDVWGQPVRGLTEDRRDALSMAVRVLAYTAMRPAEFMALRPDQVDDRAIRIEGGKTKSSWRVIPLHPEIADFPAWLHAGGVSAFYNSKTGEAQTDPVTSLRHNFTKLIRKKMIRPIIHERKALYSLRSTFQNCMRRAGAPKDVRRAILGHVESGAMRHYDDGPSFELLKKWVECSDPRR